MNKKKLTDRTDNVERKRKIIFPILLLKRHRNEIRERDYEKEMTRHYIWVSGRCIIKDIFPSFCVLCLSCIVVGIAAMAAQTEEGTEGKVLLAETLSEGRWYESENTKQWTRYFLLTETFNPSEPEEMESMQAYLYGNNVQASSASEQKKDGNLLSQSPDNLSNGHSDEELFISRESKSSDEVSEEQSQEPISQPQTEESRETNTREQNILSEEPELQVSQPSADSTQTEAEPASEVTVEAETTQGEEARVVSCSANDYDVLLRIVEAEAGGCDRKGKILVANVIINRVRDERFPDTIAEVVYENNGETYQFSPVKSGRIDRVEVSEETTEAVEAALRGEDYSQGALFFAARSKSNPDSLKWFDSCLKRLFEHDGHEFFRYYSE